MYNHFPAGKDQFLSNPEKCLVIKVIDPDKPAAGYTGFYADGPDGIPFANNINPVTDLPGMVKSPAHFFSSVPDGGCCR